MEMFPKQYFQQMQKSLKGGTRIHSYLPSDNKVNVLQEMEADSGFHYGRTENSLCCLRQMVHGKCFRNKIELLTFGDQEIFQKLYMGLSSALHQDQIVSSN